VLLFRLLVLAPALQPPLAPTLLPNPCFLTPAPTPPPSLGQPASIYDL